MEFHLFREISRTSVWCLLMGGVHLQEVSVSGGLTVCLVCRITTNQKLKKIFKEIHYPLPWVPKVFSRYDFILAGQRPADVSQRPINERQSREKTSGKTDFDLPFWMDLDPFYPITFKLIKANISYCDHMQRHVSARALRAAESI